MSYNPVTRQLDLGERPRAIITDPATMIAPGCSLHHRVPWNALGGALNLVLSGRVEVGLINALLRLSPGRTLAVIIDFKTALNRVLAQAPLTLQQVESIETVEDLICNLPMNLICGFMVRADDPDKDIDFLPADVNPDGTLPRRGGQLTPEGEMQQMREQLTHLLLSVTTPNALIDIQKLTGLMQKLWQQMRPPAPGRLSISQATAFDPADWAPAAVPGAGGFAMPAFRFWPGPPPLTPAQSKALNVTVMKRVNTVYQ